MLPQWTGMPLLLVEPRLDLGSLSPGVRRKTPAAGSSPHATRFKGPSESNGGVQKQPILGRLSAARHVRPVSPDRPVHRAGTGDLGVQGSPQRRSSPGSRNALPSGHHTTPQRETRGVFASPTTAALSTPAAVTIPDINGVDIEYSADQVLIQWTIDRVSIDGLPVGLGLPVQVELHPKILALVQHRKVLYAVQRSDIQRLWASPLPRPLLMIVVRMHNRPGRASAILCDGARVGDMFSLIKAEMAVSAEQAASWSEFDQLFMDVVNSPGQSASSSRSHPMSVLRHVLLPVLPLLPPPNSHTPSSPTPNSPTPAVRRVYGRRVALQDEARNLLPLRNSRVLRLRRTQAVPVVVVDVNGDSASSPEPEPQPQPLSPAAEAVALAMQLQLPRPPDKEIQRIIASFDPPLTHTFGDRGKMSISKADFRCLYNNEWLNDNLVEFFIRWNMDNAIDAGWCLRLEVYTFSTFFFPKLMGQWVTSAADADVVATLAPADMDYYGNVELWLTKVRLLDYKYVVLPINENSHWYCAVMVGLPNLLETADRTPEYERLKARMHRFNSHSPISAAQGSVETEELHPPPASPDAEGPPPDPTQNVGLIPLTSVPLRNKKVRLDAPVQVRREMKRLLPRATIYIVDLLDQDHRNLRTPLRRFLTLYIKARYGFEILDALYQISIRKGAVRPQPNFNDCGIHVIYNVNKFLSAPDQVLGFWDGDRRRPFSTGAPQDSVPFKEEEAQNYRTQLQQTLLGLHHQQRDESRGVSACENEAKEDSDVEMIEMEPAALSRDEARDAAKDAAGLLHAASAISVSSTTETLSAGSMPSVVEVTTSRSPDTASRFAAALAVCSNTQMPWAGLRDIANAKVRAAMELRCPRVYSLDVHVINVLYPDLHPVSNAELEDLAAFVRENASLHKREDTENSDPDTSVSSVRRLIARLGRHQGQTLPQHQRSRTRSARRGVSYETLDSDMA